MSFKPMQDLESLTPEQREQHYLDACQHFGLPPELRLLEFMWLDASDGKRNLVLYAKKGATDLIRERRNISVISTVVANGPGYAAFIVEGKDDVSGRHEFAVGSAVLNAMTQNVANSVMIAHTRAVRRLTLQFVGGGLLDESEVQGPVTDINRAGGSLASLATIPAPIQPTAPPNQELGKDVTPLSGIEGSLGVKVSSGLDAVLTGTKYGIPATTPPLPLVPLMDAPKPFSDGDITPESVEKVENLVQIEPAPKRKPGRKKAEISLDSPVSTVVETPIKPIPDTIPDKVSQTVVVPENKPVIVTTVEPSEPVNPDMPTKEETAAWKSKLSVYTTHGGILNQGGMTENIFGKLRMFTTRYFPNAVVLPNKAIMLTNTQWADLLALFEKTVAEQGPAGLVSMIKAVK